MFVVSSTKNTKRTEKVIELEPGGWEFPRKTRVGETERRDLTECLRH
jgi:hypothetical protein